jgi:GT2 family glycosyltransferase
MNNRAVGITDGTLVLLLNNDIDGFCDGWLEQLVATLQLDERIAAVGPLLYYPDGTVQHAGIFFGMGRTGRHGHVDLPHDALGYCGRLRCLQEVSCLTGAMLLVRRSAFDAIGGFDVKYPEDFNDTDLCLRLRQAGWRLAYTPHVTAFHYSSKTRRTKLDHRHLMIEQWGDQLQRDPFYSPHLSARRFELGELNRVWQQRKSVELSVYLSQTPTGAERGG